MPNAIQTSMALLTATLAIVAACGGAAAPGASSPADRGVPDGACTTMGCVDGFVLELAPAGGAWARGRYVFEVKTPAGTTTCQGDLPLPACAAGRALACSGPPVSIVESGCALPADQHGFAAIELPEGPARLEVAIHKDGAPLARHAVDPQYRTVEANGPGCGPVCRQASNRLAW